MFELLRGLRILDFTSVVLGPYATQLLADFGADVIKIEPLTGDVFRYVRPGRSETMGAGFINCNRNKRSLAIDLSSKEGQDIVLSLTKDADMVIHNMRPKSAKKLGIDYERLKAVRSDLVYCYAPGFGQNGSSAEEPAYDDTIQALSGLAFLNANANGEPRFLPTIIADKVGGLHLALSAVAGLVKRLQTGESVEIEAPMFESMVSFLLVEQLGGRSFDPPLGGTGYDRLQSPYRKPFRTADGFISVIPYTSAHWVRFFELVGRVDMCKDERVLNPSLRSRNIDFLYGLIDELTPTKTTEEWVRLLKERDVPCAHVNRVDDLFTNDHLVQSGLFEETSHPTEGQMITVRSPFRVLGKDTAPDRGAPGLGANGTTILSEAGYSDGEIRNLIKTGIVGENDPAAEKS